MEIDNLKAQDVTGKLPHQNNKEIQIEVLPKILRTFPTEIQDQYQKIPNGLRNDALCILAQFKIDGGDLLSAEQIIDIIKEPYKNDEERPYFNASLNIALVSLASAIYQQGDVEKSDKIITNILDHAKTLNLDYLFPLVSKYYLETDRVEKTKEIINATNIEKDQNLLWQLIEPLAKYELENDKPQEASSLNKYLTVEYYSTKLLAMIARNIGHKHPEEAIKILEEASKIVSKEKRGNEVIIDKAWAFIGHPERVEETNSPFVDIEFAKHHFLVGDSSTAEKLIQEAISKSKNNHYQGDTQLANIYLECGNAYLLSADPKHKEAKEYLYQAIDSVLGIEYRGLYQEDMGYEKDNIFRQIEESLIDIGDLEGLTKIYTATKDSTKSRVQLEILAMSLNKI